MIYDAGNLKIPWIQYNSGKKDTLIQIHFLLFLIIQRNHFMLHINSSKSQLVEHEANEAKVSGSISVLPTGLIQGKLFCMHFYSSPAVFPVWRWAQRDPGERR